MTIEIRQRRPFRAAAATLALLALAGCARIRTTQSKDAAFIYGFIDVPEAVGSASCVGIIQDERVGIAGRHQCMMTSPEGLFFIEDVPPMRYNIHGFYVDRTFNSLGAMAKPFAVGAGEMHFVGSFRYRELERPGIGRAGRYSLTPAARPSHAEILKKLLLQDVGPRWRTRINARLRELGAAK
ncbi:MAG: hypothetical protein WCC48_08430 [Anaeromyxobacteraceae bacterium]